MVRKLVLLPNNPWIKTTGGDAGNVPWLTVCSGIDIAGEGRRRFIRKIRVKKTGKKPREKNHEKKLKKTEKTGPFRKV